MKWKTSWPMNCSFGFLRKGGKAHLTLKEDELVLAEQ